MQCLYELGGEALSFSCAIWSLRVFVPVNEKQPHHLHRLRNQRDLPCREEETAHDASLCVGADGSGGGGRGHGLDGLHGN